MEVVTAASSGLAPLLVLACPIGMGLMMWMMMRGSRQRQKEEAPIKPCRPASLEVLREEQRRLDAEIDRLERSRGHRSRGEPMDPSSPLSS